MKHTIYFNAAQNMSPLKDKSVDIVVTSPPYPMIEMWDNIMSNQNPDIKSAFEANEPRKAFELMHQELDKVWAECWRVLKEGSFLCINIGDATRTINGEFALYNNNTRIIQACEKLGFINLPNILWRKTTNGFLYLEKAEKGFIKKQKKRKLAEIALFFGKKEMFGSLIFGKLKVLNKLLIMHHQEIGMHHIPLNYLSVL